MNLENMMLGGEAETQGSRILYDSISMPRPKNWQVHRDRKQISEGMEEEGLLQNCVGFLLGE